MFLGRGRRDNPRLWHTVVWRYHTAAYQNQVIDSRSHSMLFHL